MKAWVCENPIGVEALVFKEVPTPEPRRGQIRVAIRAASLNFPDLLIVQNKYQFKPTPPFIPGTEFAGIVDAVGDDVAGFSVGMPVAALGGTGGFATQVCVDATLAIPLSAEFAFDDAAAFICTYATGHHALIDRGQLRAGDTVLILGAAGGVGTAAIQISKAMGARVIAAASSEDKCSLCRELGADDTIDYRSADLRDSIRQITGGKGPDIIYDPVGGDVAEAAFRSIGWRGRYLVIGFAGGRIPALPLNLALLKGASAVGVFWGEFARREPERNSAALAQLADWYQHGKIKPVIDSRLPLDQLHEAFARMNSRQVRGKVVLLT